MNYKTSLVRIALGLMAVLTLAVLGAAQAPPPLYRQIAKFKLGGEGGWDYLKFDTEGNRVFVSRGNAIWVVDANTGEKTGEMPATGAHGIALVHDRNLGFYTNGRAGTVTVFDLKTLKPTGEIKVGENPDAIIYDEHSKTVVVMNGRSKDVMAIDPATMKVKATVPLGGKLEFAAADAGHVYVNIEDTGEIGVLDSATWTAGQRWKLEGCEEPSGMAIDEKENHLFSVCGNKQMMVLDTRTGKVLDRVATGGGTDASAFDPALKLAFASNGEGTLTVVQEKGGKFQVLENDPTQRGARTMALDPKSHRVFLVTAEFGPPVEGQRRPPIKPDSFTMLVYAPRK